MYTQNAKNKGKCFGMIFINERTEIQTTIESKPRSRKTSSKKKIHYILPANLVQGQEPKVRECFGRQQFAKRSSEL